jgi:hypothetical protein
VTTIRRRLGGRVEDDAAVAGNVPAIYGSLLVTTLVAVQWRGTAVPELIALTLVGSVTVFWLTHVWAEVISHRLRAPITAAEARAIATGEATMLVAVVIPALLLGLHRFGGVSADLAIGLALGASLAQLFLWGLAVGRAAHRSWPVAVGIGLVDFGFGLAIVVLKTVVLH